MSTFAKIVCLWLVASLASMALVGGFIVYILHMLIDAGVFKP